MKDLELVQIYSFIGTRSFHETMDGEALDIRSCETGSTICNFPVEGFELLGPETEIDRKVHILRIFLDLYKDGLQEPMATAVTRRNKEPVYSKQKASSRLNPQSPKTGGPNLHSMQSQESQPWPERWPKFR
jgi:hypothetical protein